MLDFMLLNKIVLSSRSGFVCFLYLSGKRDSNPRPSAWEANALPTELLPQTAYWALLGLLGLFSSRA